VTNATLMDLNLDPRRRPLIGPGMPIQQADLMAPDLGFQPQQRQNLMAPTGAQQEPAPTSLPQVDPYDQQITQARGRYDQSRQQLQAGMDELGQMQYTPQHRGLGSRIGQALVGAISPYAANAIWERPEEEQQTAYTQNLATKGRQLSAFQNAAQDSLKDIDLAQEGKRTDAYVDWSHRTPQEKPETEKFMGGDGKEHLWQFNPTSKRFDIDLGLTKDTGPQGHAMNEIEFFKQDPEGFTRYEGTKRRLQQQYNSFGNRPSSDQIKIDLYRKDPTAFNAIYGNKVDQQQNKLDTNLLNQAVRLSIDPMGLDEPNPDTIAANYLKLSELQGGSSAPGASALTPPPAPGAGTPAPGSAAPLRSSHSQAKPLTDKAKAKEYLQKAGGDRNKARALAKQDGWTF
jgi:hypothetical protein